ncbi:MAG: hypothetical protein K2O05_00615 [Anaeroplasmataceae bacterium]|nr:hypothetical protein [Anaeroplasmataceae bacterium]
MDYFGMIPDNFFSLLASKNKRIYLACILQSFKTYETGSILGIEKKIVVDDLIHFLEHTSYLYDVEDEEDEESNPQSKRDLVNYILRRMEECGWIYIDVTNDYEEILNFSDMAIVICEALLNAFPTGYDGYDDTGAEVEMHASEYQGYIFTIYSILTNPNNVDYVMTFDTVYNTTKKLIRALRRLDSRLKEYISSVVETVEIRELMERLMTFKTEIYDRSYLKMKTSDNINRYRLAIVSKLEELQNNSFAMEMILNDYKSKFSNPDVAAARANRAIDEVIDVFNSIDSFVSEIDNKNRTYINSTIGKIKFLLSEDDNIIGKLNTILKFVKTSNEKGKIDKSLRMIDTLYALNQTKVYVQGNSLYSPRGSYTRNYNQMLDDIGLEGFELTDEFMQQFKSAYNEVEIKNFLEANMPYNKLQASQLIQYNSDNLTVLMTVYSLMYASNLNYHITILNYKIEHKRYSLRDFIIERKDEDA